MTSKPVELMQPFIEFVTKFTSNDLDTGKEWREWELFLAMRDACSLLFPEDFVGYSGNIGFGRGTLDSDKTEIVSPPPIENGTLIPWRNDAKAIDLVPDVLRKTIFYTDLAIFILPYNLTSSYISYSGGLRGFDTAAVERIFNINSRFLKYVNEGQVIFLPQLFMHEASSLSDFNVARFEAPYYQDMLRFTYLPLNQSPQLSKLYGMVEEMLIYKNIILPYFPDASVTELLKIKKNETEAYERFKYVLRNKLSELRDVTRAEAITNIFEEIDYEIQSLIIESKKLLNLKVMQGINLSFFGISLLAILTASLDIPKELASMVGTMSVLNLIKEQVSFRNKNLEMKKNDFYIPYLFYKKCSSSSAIGPLKKK